MTTLNEVDIQLRAQGENEATAALKRFRDESKRLSTSVIDSGRKIESINSRWKEAERLQQKNVISAKALRAAQTQLAREYAVLNGMTEEYTRGGQKFNRTATNQAKTILLNKDATEKASAAQAQYAQRMEELRLRIDPVYRASQQYKKSLRELIQFQRASDQPMEQYRKQVALLKEEFHKVSTGGRGARRSMSNLGIGIQQTGYQISDFAIQVQSGQSALVAFSQQASQLVGVLPLVANDIGLSARKALALSAGLGIAIPLVTTAANVILNLGKESKETAEGVDQLSSALSSAKSATELHEMSVVKLIDKYGLLAFEAREASVAIAEADYRSAVQSIRNEAIPALDGLTEAFNKISDKGPAATSNTIQRLKRDFEDLSESMGLSVTGSEELISAYNEFNQANTLQDQVTSAIDLRNALSTIPDEVLAADAELNNAVESINRLFLEGSELQRQMEQLRDSTPGSSWMDNAIQGVNGLINRIIEGINKVRTLKGETDEKSFIERYEAGEFTGTPNVSGFRSAEYFNLLDKQAVSAGTSGGGSGGGSGGAGGGFDPQEYLAGLEQEARFKRSLVGLSDEQVKTEERRQSIVEKLTQDGENLTETESERVEKLLETEAQTRRLMEAEEQRQAMMDRVEDHMKNALMSVVDGSKSVEDAFRSMMRNILLAVYEQQVAQPAAEGIGNLISTGLGSLFNAKGNVFSGGDRVTAYADGGVVDRATMFPMRGGVGVMGESGPEAIMPLKRGKGGKLGVASEGGGSLTVNVVMDPSTGALGAFVQDQAGQVVAKAAPQLAQYANKTMVDQRRRGGSMKATFRG